MKKDIPVIFFHEGNHEYLKYAILSAEKYNKEVILLGDESNNNFSQNWYDASKFDLSEYHDFEKVYKHMSSNSRKFEITAFKKYYILKRYMEENNKDKCILLDSDIVTFYNYSNLEFINNYKVSVSTKKDQENYVWTSSGHSSFWTKEYLDDFLRFCLSTYKENIKLLEKKYNNHLNKKIKGGICDMTLLYLWAKDKEGVYNCAQIDSGATFDHNINTSGNYERNEYKTDKILNIKKVKFINDIPYFVDKRGQIVRTYTIHCQGSAKMIMKDFYNRNFKLLFIHRYQLLAKKFITRRILNGRRKNENLSSS